MRFNRPAVAPQSGRLVFLFLQASVILFLVGSLSACASAPIPVEEYALARAAMESAMAVDAAAHSPGYWNRGEEAYRSAEILLKDRRNDEATAEFIRARQSFEKAENAARLIRLKTGEVL